MCFFICRVAQPVASRQGSVAHPWPRRAPWLRSADGLRGIWKSTWHAI